MIWAAFTETISLAALREASELATLNGAPELIAFQLGLAERRLAEVSGRASLGPVGEEVLAEVKSSWCCIDAETLRPARLASDVIARFFPAEKP